MSDRRNLTRAELETIILFNQEDDFAEIFTYEFTWQRHIEERFGIKPYEENDSGGKTYRIPKDRIKMPVPKKVMSKKRKESLAKSLIAARANKK